MKWIDETYRTAARAAIRRGCIWAVVMAIPGGAIPVEALGDDAWCADLDAAMARAERCRADDIPAQVATII